MRLLLPVLLTITLAAPLVLYADDSLVRAADESNVNQRYVIESVSIAGMELERLPASLRRKVESLVGARCDMAVLEDLSSDFRKQLHFRTVTEHLAKGSEPGRVKVSFELASRDRAFDVSLPRFLYHSGQGFTGEIDASAHSGTTAFNVGFVSNGDDLTERFSGLTARLDSQVPGADRLRYSVALEDYCERWNSMTTAAAAGSGLDLYTARWNVAPEITFVVAKPLTVSLGTSFEKMDSELPTNGARWANSGLFDVNYGYKIEGDRAQQRVDGHYSLRLATRAFGSTYAYARHMITLRYEAKAGRHSVTNQFIAGSIAGTAPFFERFVLGSSSTLRGWDRYEIDPVGGSRVVHNEMTYGYRTRTGTVEGFYDAGSLWQTDRAAKLRHSVGVGFRQGIFVLTMAFPVGGGRVEPVFMAGMNY